jgi:hypothetical protein
MDIPCRSSWTGAHENFQAREYDAGASQISKRAWSQRNVFFEHMINCSKIFLKIDAPNL